MLSYCLNNNNKLKLFLLHSYFRTNNRFLLHQDLAKNFWANWIYKADLLKHLRSLKKMAFCFRKVNLSISYIFFKTSCQYVFLLWWDSFFTATSATETFLHPGCPLIFFSFGHLLGKCTENHLENGYKALKGYILKCLSCLLWTAVQIEPTPVFSKDLSFCVGILNNY